MSINNEYINDHKIKVKKLRDILFPYHQTLHTIMVAVERRNEASPHITEFLIYTADESGKDIHFVMKRSFIIPNNLSSNRDRVIRLLSDCRIILDHNALSEKPHMDDDAIVSAVSEAAAGYFSHCHVSHYAV